MPLSGVLAAPDIQTLRYYERRGLIAEPLRSLGGHRAYPPETTDQTRVPEGLLATASITRAQRGSDFASLSRRITQEGLLDRRPWYYATRISLVAFLFAGSWAAFAAVGDSSWQFLVAALLAVALAQVTLLAHDLAHGQVFRSRRTSRAAGLFVGNLCAGLSYGWWQDKHTRHHANPNHEDRDPDVAPDVLIWPAKQAEGSRGALAPKRGHLEYRMMEIRRQGVPRGDEVVSAGVQGGRRRVVPV
ncbi:fatty acid desaturase, partial [Nonomuraea sp. B12E4]|uniref:fatty acid desaturase n=1 Tax=Nonomuraea sp. B12E4 TaxID=3153564 RepID=UPI00325F423B